MNVLDELIPGPQRELLEQWRIRVRQIGRDMPFSTHARRCGTVVRVGHVGIHFWRLGVPEEQFVNWRAN